MAGEMTMIPMMLALVVLSVVIAVGLYVSERLVNIIRYDKLLAQRMVDYSGFVDLGTQRD